MPNPHKTPGPRSSSSLYLSPNVAAGMRPNVFATPPNPAHNTFTSPHVRRVLLLFRAHDTSLDPTTDHALPADELRAWRLDAYTHHNLGAARFVADKVLALTGSAHDAFWLAQVYVALSEFLRAHLLLISKPDYLASDECCYLAAYCLTRLERWDDALDLIGEGPLRGDGDRNVAASTCMLRGRIYANQNDFERAKDCYKEALMLDVRCYDAFAELIENNLMTATEEWEFVDSLNYASAGANHELVKALYTMRLSKYLNVPEFNEAEQVLGQEYELQDNCDVLAGRADYWYVHCNFDECLRICEKILAADPYNFNIIPHHLACLHELGAKNKLFYKAHQLAQDHPKHPYTWLAIGIYYLAINKINDARKYFSKATLLDPNFGHAWIGFAHTFAAEGEHEQAISAYAFAARLYPGTHLPNLFLGMQHLQMGNLNLAEEYLAASYHICKHDPLLLNEYGVIAFHKNQLGHAEHMLREALSAAKHLNSDSKTWIAIHSNLGHVYRRSGQPQQALECFLAVRRISNRNDPNILLALALVYLQLRDHVRAIDAVHDALAILPTDPVALDLLKRALETNAHDLLVFLDGIASRAIALNMPTLEHRQRQRQSQSQSQSQRLPVPRQIRSQQHDITGQRPNREADSSNPAQQAERLVQGEDTSDDAVDNEEGMDIESD